MTQSLAHALGFGFSWLALSLFIAAMPFFGRSKHQRVRGLPLNSEQKAVRRSIVVAGVVSALCGTIAAWLHGHGFNQAMLLAIVAAAVVATAILLTHVFSFDRRQTQDGPPVTGYRAKPPAHRDGPYT